MGSVCLLRGTFSAVCFNTSLSAARLIWITARTPLVFSKRFIVWAFGYERSHDYFHPGEMGFLFPPGTPVWKCRQRKNWNLIKGAICRNKESKETNSLWRHDWINWLILKDDTVSYCFTLYSADPATFQAPSLIFPREQLVYPVVE